MSERQDSRRRKLGWSLVFVLVSTAIWWPRPQPARTPPLAQRLIGPLANMVAALQWARADLALSRGDTALGLARAERALSFDPQSSGGWNLLVNHLGMDMAAPSRERNPQIRLARLRAALTTLDRGVELARDPSELIFLRGILLALTALRDPELPWPGGPRALWIEAAKAYETAAQHGHPEGTELAAAAHLAARDT